MTSVLTTGGIAIGVMCLTLAAIHVLMARRLPNAVANRWFAVTAALAAINAFIEPLAFSTGDIGSHVPALKWAIFVQGLCWIAFVWYVRYYSGTARRWLAWLVSAGFGIALVVHVVSPYGVLYSEIQSLRIVRLPWGESYSLPQGPLNPWRIVSDTAILLLVVYVADAGLSLVRRGSRHRARRLAAATTCLLVALIHGSLVDLGVLTQPYLMSYAFLALLVVVGLDLADDAVRAAKLSRQVRESERRWSALLQKARLLVATMDGRGVVQDVNPFFSHQTGFTDEDVVGKPLDELLPSEERDRIAGVLAQARTADVLDSTDTRLRTKEGNELAIHWSHVPLTGDGGESAGMVSVGADVTEQRRAEIARDRAVRELEQLRDRLKEENLYLREEIQLDRGGMNMVGESDALAYVRHRIREVGMTDTTVLIHGETGVGKELVAHAIYTCGGRSDRPFIRVPCAALPSSLIESELFGHVAGAYTGATGERKGRFELADGGTILLDEVGELPLELQGKLLRVLQEGEFERVGSSTTIHVDVRVLAATNRDLSAEVAAGRFRSDLYFRLNVFPITVPPLRDRRSDIPLLVEHIVRTIAQRLGRHLTEVPASVLRQLQNYDWPGNVRELGNVLERAVITSRAPELRLPEPLVSAPVESPEEADGNGEWLRPLKDIEKQHIQRTLGWTKGRIAGPGGAAEILGLHPNTLRSRMQKLGISAKR